MLVENSREETLKAFLNGNKGTMAAIRQEDGSMRLAHIISLLPADAVYFINVDLEPGEDYENKILGQKQGETETDPFPAKTKLGEALGAEKEDDKKMKKRERRPGILSSRM